MLNVRPAIVVALYVMMTVGACSNWWPVIDYCQSDAMCDDGDECTDDLCMDGLCSNVPNAVGCDDGDSCTSDDRCTSGYCEGTSVVCPGGQICDGGQCTVPTDPCVSQCEPGPRVCLGSIDIFEPFDATRQSWHEELNGLPMDDVDHDGRAEFPLLIAGTCEGGSVLFLFMSGGLTFELRYYYAGSREFFGMISMTDGIDEVCQGSSYWPRVIECLDGVVTEVLMGTFYDVGDSIVFPWPPPL